MNGQLRLNVILPIVLLAAAGAALSLFMLSRGAGASTTAADSVAPLPRVVAPKPGRTARPAKPSTPEAPPKPARPKVKLNAGLPPALARALTARPVAVVAFVTPHARLDEMAAKEAAAGARAGGASFVTVDVSRERQARPFAVKLGVLEAPTVLVFKRPGDLFVRLDGFTDLDVVAQAAENAKS
ncbi:MAG TPA: hypothetical protein VKA45_05305 [Gaiellaceae bacterium]|nr:hypothetical protein [Gaiellaceae bacterium]